MKVLSHPIWSNLYDHRQTVRWLDRCGYRLNIYDKETGEATSSCIGRGKNDPNVTIDLLYGFISFTLWPWPEASQHPSDFWFAE